MSQTQDKPAIRPAKPEDAARCGDIAVAAWQRVFDSWRTLLGEELFTQHFGGWEDDKRQQVEGQIREHPELAIVTELDAAVVGFLTFHLSEEKQVGEIGNNAVDPQCQGHGVGTRQCKRALEIFREKGMTSAAVYTGLDEGHAPARTMYEKAGFDLSLPHIRYYMWL